MTRKEFEQRVKNENLKMEDYSIELDEYRSYNRSKRSSLETSK